ncbi:MAG: rRNA methyltransferase [Actinobacteria bacterium 13_2_20CM_2_71_6]|nr:MAG: rRNA methyltransferase [Actinobacteria bacterium 13_2_20CM_2_71_6]
MEDEVNDGDGFSAGIGVGPWAGPWPEDPRYDPALLAGGDRRNVVDRYRYWRREAIVADLDTRRHEFHVAIENWQHDLNIGTVVRNANAFLAAEVHIVGKRKWNRRGAMVTDRYQHVRHHETIEEFLGWAAGEGLALFIAQYGSTRSINAGVASGIAMHAWIRRWAQFPDSLDGSPQGGRT